MDTVHQAFVKESIIRRFCRSDLFGIDRFRCLSENRRRTYGQTVSLICYARSYSQVKHPVAVPEVLALRHIGGNEVYSGSYAPSV